MSYLLVKEQMQSLNIDSVEKAIVFGALALKVFKESGLSNPNTEIAIEPVITRSNTSFAISGSFALDTQKYYKTGGIIFNNLLEVELPSITPLDIRIAPLTYPFQLISLARKWDIQPSNSLEPIIPDYPSWFKYFEQYLLYYFFVYWVSIGVSYSRDINLELITENSEIEESIDGIDGAETTSIIIPEKQKINFSINLPVNFETWFLGGNYLNSVERTLATYRIPDLENFRLEALSKLTNTDRLTNREKLIN